MPRLLGRFGLAILGMLIFAAPACADTVGVTFLLVNDIDQMGEIDGRGGYARVAAVVKAERAARDNVVFVHAGDAISPSLLSGIDQGAHIINLINMTQPDIFVPGNHEFDFGPEVFRRRMSEASFPRLAANLRDAGGQRLPGFEDTRMLEVQGVRIGIVGVLTEESDVTSTLGDLVLGPALGTALEQAKELREGGAQLVVAVAHVPRSADRQLFESRAVDLILSGDDHDLMIQFDGRTVLAESLSQGKYVTAIDLTIETSERDGTVSITWWPDFRVIDTANVEPDAEVAALVGGFEAELSSELDIVIGRTGAELDSRRAAVRTGEAAIGNLIADAMRETTDADVSLMNGGGIRADRVYPPGTEITRRNVLAELPFGNRVVTVEVTGDLLRQTLEHGFSRIEDAAGRFPQISGMAIEADFAAPVGSRVKSVMVNGEPLDPGRIYTLATLDFIIRGGDGYAMLVDAPRIVDERDGPLLAATVMAAIRKRGEINAKVEGRIATGG